MKVGSFGGFAGRGNMFSASRTADCCVINVTRMDIMMPVKPDTTTPYNQAVKSWATGYKDGKTHDW
jgi:hypothetical protein